VEKRRVRGNIQKGSIKKRGPRGAAQGKKKEKEDETIKGLVSQKGQKYQVPL